MIRSAHLAILLFVFSLPAEAQVPAIAQARPLPVNPPYRQQASAIVTQDTSAASGDHNTKPTGAKGSTLIGCLAGPDKDGKYTLRNMAYRMGVQVLGSSDLKNDSGSKVKLTGQWQPLSPQQVQHRDLLGTPLPQAPATVAPSQQPAKSQEPQKESGETHRFQATDVEVLAQTCQAPSETTPVSKTRPQKPTTYNAPSSENPR